MTGITGTADIVGISGGVGIGSGIDSFSLRYKSFPQAKTMPLVAHYMHFFGCTGDQCGGVLTVWRGS